eukprot:Ihof_evm15s28 gene=Ihof_evmTU15s28
MTVRKSYQLVSQENREKIENKTLQGISVKDIAEALNLHYQTVYKIVQKFNEFGTIATARGGDRRSKLSADQKLQVLGWINNNCLLRLSDLTTMVQNKLSIKVSASAIERILLPFHYTVKNLESVLEITNDATTIEKRFHYAIRFRELEQNTEDKNLIFCGKAEFSVFTRTKARGSHIGILPYVTVGGRRSKNISIFVAVN